MTAFNVVGNVGQDLLHKYNIIHYECKRKHPHTRACTHAGLAPRVVKTTRRPTASKFVSQHSTKIVVLTAGAGGGCHLPQWGSSQRESPPEKLWNFKCKFLPSGAQSARKLTPVKVQNTTHLHSGLYHVHPARDNAKNGTTGVLARTQDRGPENRTSRQKRARWQPYQCFFSSTMTKNENVRWWK